MTPPCGRDLRIPWLAWGQAFARVQLPHIPELPLTTCLHPVQRDQPSIPSDVTSALLPPLFQSGCAKGTYILFQGCKGHSLVGGVNFSGLVSNYCLKNATIGCAGHSARCGPAPAFRPAGLSASHPQRAKVGRPAARSVNSLLSAALGLQPLPPALSGRAPASMGHHEHWTSHMPPCPHLLQVTESQTRRLETPLRA